MILDPRNRQLLQRSIDAMQQFADSYHNSARTIAANGILTRDTGWPERLLKVALTADRAEQILADLHRLLDHPPGLGAAQPLRAVPDPLSGMDAEPEPGLANAAAGHSSAVAG